MSLIIKNIGCLVGASAKTPSRYEGVSMNEVPCIENAYLISEQGRIKAFGTLNDDINAIIRRHCADVEDVRVIDANDGWVFPSFCDSHTHIVYASSREREFEDRIKGLTYEEIAANGGGILNSADILRRTSEQQLYETAIERVCEVAAKGTGAIEIKSGYGLSLESELKMLRVIQRIKDSVPLLVKSTFLGAHAVPREYTGNREGYVSLICREMIPAVASEKLADFVDVFCDNGFFTVTDTSRILEAAAKYGLRPKIHADELARSGGTETGVRNNALSVDHLERTTQYEIDLLKDCSTIPTVLPGASFFLGMPYAPARMMIDNGLPVAIASDYNPGSSPSGDMRFMLSLGCIKMKLTVSEALAAVTLNGAYAMGAEKEVGSITLGKRTSLFITRPMSSLAFLAYAYTTPVINRIILEDIEYPVNRPFIF